MLEIDTLETDIEKEESLLYTPTDQIGAITPFQRTIGWGGKGMLLSYSARIVAGITAGDITDVLPFNDWIKGGGVALTYFVLQGIEPTKRIGGNIKQKVIDWTELSQQEFLPTKLIKQGIRLALIDPNVDKALGFGYGAFGLIHAIGEIKEALGFGYDTFFPETIEDAKAYTTFHEAMIGAVSGAYAKFKTKLKSGKTKAYAKAVGLAASIGFVWEGAELALFGSAEYGDGTKDWLIDSGSDIANALIVTVLTVKGLKMWYNYKNSGPGKN